MAVHVAFLSFWPSHEADGTQVKLKPSCAAVKTKNRPPSSRTSASLRATATHCSIPLIRRSSQPRHTRGCSWHPSSELMVAHPCQNLRSSRVPSLVRTQCNTQKVQDCTYCGMLHSCFCLQVVPSLLPSLLSSLFLSRRHHVQHPRCE